MFTPLIPRISQCVPQLKSDVSNCLSKCFWWSDNVCPAVWRRQCSVGQHGSENVVLQTMTCQRSFPYLSSRHSNTFGVMKLSSLRKPENPCSTPRWTLMHSRHKQPSAGNSFWCIVTSFRGSCLGERLMQSFNQTSATFDLWLPRHSKLQPPLKQISALSASLSKALQDCLVCNSPITLWC